MFEIFLDTETTGLSTANNDKIVEIACIETKDLIATGKIFHKIINPKRDVPDSAVKIHGFTTDFLKDKAPFEEIADEFLNFVKGKKIIIHNADFDLSFINNELAILNKGKIDKIQTVDSLELARGKFPGSSNSLDSLCKRFNIDLSKRTKHNALLDCELLREVYINLLDVKEPKLSFSSQKSNYKINNQEKEIPDYCKKIVDLTNNEVESHKLFLKKELKKNFF